MDDLDIASASILYSFVFLCFIYVGYEFWLDGNVKCDAFDKESASSPPYTKEKLSYLISNATGTYVLYYDTVLFLALFAFATPLMFLNNGWIMYASFLAGALVSLFSCTLSTLVSCKCNAKAVQTAKLGIKESFNTAFGTSLSSAVISLSLNVVCVSLLLLVFQVVDVLKVTNVFKSLQSLSAYALGTSFVALFSRLTGGIFTKATLLGSGYDTVPPNLKTQAGVTYSVGNFVHDVFGLNAEVFATSSGLFCGYFVLLSRYLCGEEPKQALFAKSFTYLAFPLILLTFSIFFSLLVSLIFKLFLPLKGPCSLLLTFVFLLGATIFLVLSFLPLFLYAFLPSALAHSSGYSKFTIYGLISLGVFTGLAVFGITLFFTHWYFPPSKSVSNGFVTSAVSGSLGGYSFGHISVFVLVIFVTFVTLISFYTTDEYGISFTSMGLLCSLALVLVLGTFTPIVSSGFYLSEVATDIPLAEDILSALSSSSYLVGSLVRTFNLTLSYFVSLTLVCSYMDAAKVLPAHLIEPFVYVSALFGVAFPFLLVGLVVKFTHTLSTYVANHCVKDEDSTALANSSGFTRGLTFRALLYAALPGFLSVALPVGFGSAFGKNSLTAYVLTSQLVGVVFTFVLNNSGSIWESSHNYASSGKLGSEHGKGSATHRNTGRLNSIGGFFKDVASPVLNLFVIVTPLVAIVFSRFVRKHCSDEFGFPHWLSSDDGSNVVNVGYFSDAARAAKAHFEMLKLTENVSLGDAASDAPAQVQA